MEEILPLLRSLGYGCTYLPGPDEAVAGPSRPDLVVLSGEILGGARGLAYQRLRMTFPGVPIVIVAHVRSLSAAIGFLRAGAADYLCAPLAPDEARERLEEILGRPVKI